MLTFSNQAKLGRLPIPKLADTLELYKRSIAPLATTEELKRSVELVDDFANSHLAGIVQKRLEIRQETQPHNWIEDWWYDRVYLEWRVPLVINSNWWLLLRKDHINCANQQLGPFTRVQLRRAACVTANLLKYRALLDGACIPSDGNCMNQFRQVFGITRIPIYKRDRLMGTFPADASHICVLIDSVAYVVDCQKFCGLMSDAVLDKKSLDSIVVDCASALESTFEHMTKDKRNSQKISVLTAGNRDYWADTRTLLLVKNKDALHKIESSLFTVSIDSNEPLDHVQAVAKGLDSKALNRWFDKSLNIVAMPSGNIGCNGEHSPQDALTPASIFEFVVGQESQTFEKVKPSAELEYNRVDFVLDKEIDKRIEFTLKESSKITADSDIKSIVFNGYGNEYMKKYGKVSPDAYVQIAMQLAYFRQHKKLVSTYETASTRRFLHGRTEACRVVSHEILEFVTKFNFGAIDLFKKAAEAHSRYMRRASEGLGIDRHLLGLRLCLREETPKMFADPLYARSSEWKLSTSSLSYTAHNAFSATGFGAVNPQGYGINYFSGPNHVCFGIESKHACAETDSAKMGEEICRALVDLRTLTERAHM